MYINCMLYSVLSSPTNAQRLYINNIYTSYAFLTMYKILLTSVYIYIYIYTDVNNIIYIYIYNASVGL